MSMCEKKYSEKICFGLNNKFVEKLLKACVSQSINFFMKMCSIIHHVQNCIVRIGKFFHSLVFIFYILLFLCRSSSILTSDLFWIDFIQPFAARLFIVFPSCHDEALVWLNTIQVSTHFYSDWFIQWYSHGLDEMLLYRIVCSQNASLRILILRHGSISASSFFEFCRIR